MKTRQNLPEIIADELRKAIIDGKLQPGDRLKQQALAEQFQASLIPVREALRSLENESFVEIIPNKGAVVTALSASEIKQLFDARIILETSVLKCSIPHLSESDIKELYTFLKKMDKSDNKRVGQHNKLFHQKMYSGCNNRYLIDMVFEHYAHSIRYLNVYLSDNMNNEQSQQEHLALIKAIEQKDIKQALSLLEEHLTTASEQLLAKIDE